MRKTALILLTLLTLLGCGAAFAMGPDEEAEAVGFTLESFTVSDAILSPYTVFNWSGAINKQKTYAAGDPIWFVAQYKQHKETGTARDFIKPPDPQQVPPAPVRQPGVPMITTGFMSEGNTVDFSMSMSNINFVRIEGLNVFGGPVRGLTNPDTTGEIKADSNLLQVTFVPQPQANADMTKLHVIDADPNKEGTYYLQFMAFTKQTNAAQGKALAKMPEDIKQFLEGCEFPILLVNDISLLPAVNPKLGPYDRLNLYDDNGKVKYIALKYVFMFAFPGIPDIDAREGDFLYMIYDPDGVQIIGFVSSKQQYKGMVKVANDMNNAGAPTILPVQYTGDSGGKYAFTDGGAGVAGTEAIRAKELNEVMKFLGFSFDNKNPILDRHFAYRSGKWTTKTAVYNVAK